MGCAYALNAWEESPLLVDPVERTVIIPDTQQQVSFSNLRHQSFAKHTHQEQQKLVYLSVHDPTETQGLYIGFTPAHQVLQATNCTKFWLCRLLCPVPIKLKSSLLNCRS